MYKHLFLITLSFSIVFTENSSKTIQDNIDKERKKADKINQEIMELKNKITNQENASKSSINKINDIEKKLKMTQELIELIKDEKTNLN